MNIEFTLNGETVECPAGCSLAGALFLLGRRAMRFTARDGTARSWFCGMGICYDCLMRVDGQSDVRACQTIVRPGMAVEVQRGEGRVGDRT